MTEWMILDYMLEAAFAFEANWDMWKSGWLHSEKTAFTHLDISEQK